MRASGSAVRGALSGLIAGAGAWTAHALFGGVVAPLAGTVALVVSVGLGRLVAADGDPRRVAALALAAQSLWHLVFMGSTHLSPAAPAAPAGPAQPGDGAVLAMIAMLAAHLLVAAASAGLAIGLDRALVSAAVRIAASLVPRLVLRCRPAHLPWAPAPVMSEPVPPHRTDHFLVVRILRGPPRALASALG
jgi:hypothetical protein